MESLIVKGNWDALAVDYIKCRICHSNKPQRKCLRVSNHLLADELSTIDARLNCLCSRRCQGTVSPAARADVISIILKRARLGSVSTKILAARRT